MLILDLQVRIPSKVETPAGSPVKQPQTEVPTSFNYDNHAHAFILTYVCIFAESAPCPHGSSISS